MTGLSSVVPFARTKRCVGPRPRFSKRMAFPGAGAAKKGSEQRTIAQPVASRSKTRTDGMLFAVRLRHHQQSIRREPMKDLPHTGRPADFESGDAVVITQ